MKTFTKTCVLALVLFFSTSLVAQQSMKNQIGTKAPDKMELIQLKHGPTVEVPYKPSGSTKATGDDCTDPFIVTLPYSGLNHTTAGALNDYDNTCLNDFDGGEDVIYEMTLASETTILVTLDPKGTKHAGIALNDDCFDSPSSVCLALATDTWGDGLEMSFTITLDAGTYYFMVDTWPNPTSIPDYDLTIIEAGTAPNDECADAIEIGEVTNYLFNNELGTGSSSCGGDATIWYKYTPTFTGDAFIDLCGSLFDTKLGVYDACGGTELACGDDDCGGGDLQSKVLISVTTGTPVWIEIGGFGGDTGDGYLSIYQKEDCPLTCSGTPEGETCGDDTNGGCNMAVPAFTSVSDGTVICGNAWAGDGLDEVRDTDWFEVVLTSFSSVTMTAEAEENIIIGIVAQAVPGVAGCTNTLDYLSTYEFIPACQEGFVTLGFLAPGTYYFFLAPDVYQGLEYPGFDYQATFDIESLDTGTLSGTVTDGTNPIEGVIVTVDIYTDVTDVNGDYSFTISPGTYDVQANGFTLGYSTEEVTGAVVTKDNVTDVDFVLDPDNSPILVSAFGSFNKVKLLWTPAAKGLNQGGKDGNYLAGMIESNNDYDQITMDLDFTLTVYSSINYVANYATLTFPAGFTINSADNLNAATPTIAGQTITWNGNILIENTLETIDFSVNVTVDPSVVGPQGIDYYVEGPDIDPGNPPLWFDGSVTVYEDGGAYVPTFNLYRKLGPIGSSNTFIPIAYGVIGNEYIDEIEAGDWCYFVTQIKADKTETAASNIMCVTVSDYCTDAIDYGQVNDPEEIYIMSFEEEVVWFKFEVPYMMDVMVSTCSSDFNTQFAIYEDCGDFTGILPTGAFDHVTDGCSDKATENYQYLDAGTYYVAVWDEGGGYGQIELEITQIQMFCIQDNWSGYSIYMDPIPPTTISTVLADVADNMVISIRQTPYGIWWPPQNINTIGNISPLLGYKAKTNALDCTVIYGTEVADKTVNLPQGASYLPVRVSYPVDVTDLFSMDPSGNKLLIVYDMHTNEVFWPIGGVFNLTQLWPGTAYLVNMIAGDAVTYPAAKNTGPVAIPSFEYKQVKSTWNEVKLTGNPHFISISQDALHEAVSGDVIGVFDANGICVGIAEYACEACHLYIAANGDDEYTTEKDGLAIGEKMNFRLYRPSTGQEFGLTPTYNGTMPNSDGLFQLNGISQVTGFKFGPTSIHENQLSNISIYPNPSNGLFTISGIVAPVDLVVTNAQGQETFRSTVKNNAQLDLSSLPNGIYFVKLMSENSVRIEKVVLK